MLVLQGESNLSETHHQVDGFLLTTETCFHKVGELDGKGQMRPISSYPPNFKTQQTNFFHIPLLYFCFPSFGAPLFTARKESTREPN
jgi:hypothetical protein